MNIPKLRKKKTKKNYHGITLEDDYSWVDQPNILEVLKDPKKQISILVYDNFVRGVPKWLPDLKKQNLKKTRTSS